MVWKLADAKNRFSEVVRRALSEGPQRIQRREDAVYVLSEREYERLAGEKQDFITFLLDAPDISDLDLERDPTPLREPGL